MDYDDEIDDDEPVGHDPNRTTTATLKVLNRLEEWDQKTTGAARPKVSMEAAKLHKLIARLDSENVHEQHAALAAIDWKSFTDIAMALESIIDAERRTGYHFSDIIKIIVKRWPKPEPGWAGMSETKKFAFHRMIMEQDWLADHERRRLIELNDRMCLASGNPVNPGDAEFMELSLAPG
jgi:hypothetical protein